MKSKLSHYFIVVTGAILLMSGSCNKKEVTCDGDHPGLTYDKDIKQIVDDNCKGCHEGYGTYAGLSVSVDNGEFEREVIVRQTMPQGSKLSEDELTIIKCWLEQGAPEN